MHHRFEKIGLNQVNVFFWINICIYEQLTTFLIKLYNSVTTAHIRLTVNFVNLLNFKCNIKF